MIGTTACASSLDALYSELAEHVAPLTLAQWESDVRSGGGGRRAEVAAVLKLALDVDTEPWKQRLRTLYDDLRNPAVHPKVKPKPAVPHPVLGSTAPEEYATYTVEAVTESVDLLVEILATCLEHPRPSIEAWVADSQGVVGQLSSASPRCVREGR
jgi:hypothetical protein